VGNVSELALAASCGAKAEIRGCIPIHNAFALDKLERAGAAGVWLSPELTLAEIQSLAPHANVPVGIIVSGRPRVMTSEHCVLKVANRCIHDCARCALRRRMIALRDRDGRLLPVRTDLNGRSRIYDAVPLDLTPQVGELIEAGVTRFAVDATLLNEAETRAAVERLLNALAAVREGRKPASRERHSSSGHLFWGIG
jgi:putative protease